MTERPKPTKESKREEWISTWNALAESGIYLKRKYGYPEWCPLCGEGKASEKHIESHDKENK